MGSLFIPSPANVLNVKSILWHKRLPAELIDPIIDFAEYWPRLVTEVDVAMTVDNNGSLLYLRTQPLPGLFSLGSGEGEDGEHLLVGDTGARILDPARKIVFRIWSHDQSWSSYPNSGTYLSYSWFEAFLERPLSIAAIRDAVPLSNPVDITNDSKLTELQSSNGKQAWRTIPVPAITKSKSGLENVATEKSLWLVRHNVQAEWSQTQHEIVWAWADYDQEQAKAYNELTEARIGGDLVRGMRPGDRLNVVARTMHPGWENHIQKMQVEVFYAI